MSRYLFDNAAPQAEARFSALESGYDAVSRKALAATGLGPGWVCLEVGGGGGSLGDWLGARVGPHGEVTVTDVKPDLAESRPRPANVRVLRHDITRDPLPAEGYDLVHARLVLTHLPERLPVLERLAGALRPGGWLVLEDFDCRWTPVLASPDDTATALFERVHTALLTLLEQAGAAPRWGLEALSAMRRAGLTEVTATTFAQSWPGGGEEIGLYRANVEQVAGRIGESGITAAEVKRFLALLDDPALVVNSYPLVSTRGRQPRKGGQ